MKVLLLHVRDKNVIHAFEADGLRLAELRGHCRQRRKRLYIQAQQSCAFWASHQPHLGGQGDHAGAFRTTSDLATLKPR